MLAVPTYNLHITLVEEIYPTLSCILLKLQLLLRIKIQLSAQAVLVFISGVGR